MKNVALALALATTMAACGSPGGPAPVVHRSSSPSSPPRVISGRTPAARSAPAVAAPVAAAPARSVSRESGVLSNPVRSGRVDSRALPGSKPATRAAAPIASRRPSKASRPTRPAPVAKKPPKRVRQASSSVRARKFAWPARGAVTKSFADPRSLGIAIAGRRGDPVSAAADGKVIFSGLGPKGYGKLLIVKHADELLSVYGNNSSLLVKEGQAVRRGQKIAVLGSSKAGKARLHFEIRSKGKPVDPIRYLPRR